ncbi:MAG: nucleoside 2-deoxyribosyltransferase [Candidatus Jorgensenbacteria bacterium]|nr:nucleoside 2-deoxyribosyltransferase [Candidatus Jorgensenbacteria bacterium]
MGKKKIYLAGPLFNVGERLHNLFLEKHLTAWGYEVILPQREALKFFNGKVFNVKGIVEDCRKNSADGENVFVCNTDGPDADSGACVEYGIATAITGRAVVYRTDFRTDTEKELGVNAMLQGKGTVFIYEPCFFTELDQVEEYYQKLAKRIHDAILTL